MKVAKKYNTKIRSVWSTVICLCVCTCVSERVYVCACALKRSDIPELQQSCVKKDRHLEGRQSTVKIGRQAHSLALFPGHME